MSRALEHPAVVKVPALLSVADAAQLLGCSSTTLRRRIHEGDLTAVVDHGLLRVRGDDLRAYIDDLPTVGRRTPRRRRRRPATSDTTYDYLRQ